MIKVTFSYAGFLILLGLGGYVLSSGVSWTALIPAFFGVAILILGLIARNDRHRMWAMHVAVVLAFLGLAGSVSGLVKLVMFVVGQQPLARPFAAGSQALMALATALFLVICVRSFIAARRRQAQSPG